MFMSHAVKLGDMSLYNHDHAHCSICGLSPTYTILLLQILTGAPDVY